MPATQGFRITAYHRMQQVGGFFKTAQPNETPDRGKPHIVAIVIICYQQVLFQRLEM